MNQFIQRVLIRFAKVITEVNALNAVSGNAEVVPVPGGDLASAGATFWRPKNVITTAQRGRALGSKATAGTAAAAIFNGGIVRENVPSHLDYDDSIINVAMPLDGLETMHPEAMDQFSMSAAAALRSEIDNALCDAILAEGSITAVASPTMTAVGTYRVGKFRDLAQADTIMTGRQIADQTRRMFISPEHKLNLASDVANNGLLQGLSQKAYESVEVMMIGGFKAMRTDYTGILESATGGALLVNGANQFYTPRSADKNRRNVDPRYFDLRVDGGTIANVKKGDRFTIGSGSTGVYSIGRQNKKSTGRLMTFTVVEDASAGDTSIKITPPIKPADVALGKYGISATGSDTATAGTTGGAGSVADDFRVPDDIGGTSTARNLTGDEIVRRVKDNANVDKAPGDNATINWLNTATSSQPSIFYNKAAVELLTTSLPKDKMEHSNFAKMETLDNGIPVLLTIHGDHLDYSCEVRMSCCVRANILSPEQTGVVIDRVIS